MKCVICGSTNVVEVHCKVVCKNCGFTRGCSDPFSVYCTQESHGELN